MGDGIRARKRKGNRKLIIYDGGAGLENGAVNRMHYCSFESGYIKLYAKGLTGDNFGYIEIDNVPYYAYSKLCLLVDTNRPSNDKTDTHSIIFGLSTDASFSMSKYAVSKRTAGSGTFETSVNILGRYDPELYIAMKTNTTENGTDNPIKIYKIWLE